ncbi:phosphotriesterase family protein [Salmonella bongori]|uniref:Phosphotriesterase n=2 Tax=Salmonella TaxID=590 RepID=A0A750KP44_SALER|nr:phosphotriesterase [Salmonella bongori]AID26199.1 phosphotriesterase [Salmonella bongori serovar 48:z41:-- str. RKS3044]EGS1128887.1 phosphotriesterase [Salmonella bongori CFSAN000509]MBA2135517.1 phosphotriesterase [Salmonella bongori serovar 66:z39:-]HAC6693019.1 phosphotriesterase [Salmonella bongori serovar 44:r:-]
MKGYLQTVTGPIAKEEMGLTLPHEHLFNDLSSVVDKPHYAFSEQLVDKKVSAEIQWGLKHDPYCCADNMDKKPIADVIFEINNFMSLGGKTIVDATGSESIGRDAQSLREVAVRTGLNIVASSGPYLEKFESHRIHQSVDTLAAIIDNELNQGIGETDIRAGMIGEIGVSPAFTEAEHNSLRAASLAQVNNPHVAMNIHMPGWLRRGDEVLDIVLGEMQVSPAKVSLAHSDPSGKDLTYQRKMLDRGVWLEFDMIGLDITFPKEGVAPGVQETADAVAHLIELGYANQLVLSHDVFLKQMWAKNGGNGWGFVPNVFLAYLAERGVHATTLRKLCIDNPARLLTD